MIERFRGPHAIRLITDAIAQQAVVYGNHDLAALIAGVAGVIPCETGSTLIAQNGTDNDLSLILAGQFSIQVNEREVARRVAGEHVGEMALIDPTARRSASVVASEESVVAKISEATFTSLATRHPELWRGLARELGARLRQRNTLVRRRNQVVHIFIGSSTETLPIANALQSGLAHGPYIVTVWTNRVFGASDFSLEALENVTNKADFAVLVLGPDDRVVSRHSEIGAPRDNVIFELGLFIGALGRRRVFIVMPRATEIKIPTDLLGITPITFAQGDPRDLAARLGPVCTELAMVIAERGPR